VGDVQWTRKDDNIVDRDHDLYVPSRCVKSSWGNQNQKHVEGICCQVFKVLKLHRTASMKTGVLKPLSVSQIGDRIDTFKFRAS